MTESGCDRCLDLERSVMTTACGEFSGLVAGDQLWRAKW